MVPGLPYAGRRETDWKLTQTNDWSFENSLRSPASPFSLTGFIARSRAAGASMTITATGDQGAHTVHVCASTSQHSDVAAMQRDRSI